MLGSLTSREHEILKDKKKKKVAAESNKNDDEHQLSMPAQAKQADDLDEGELHWETELEQHAQEKSRAFSILSQFVPQSEIFFNHHSASLSSIK